LNNGDFHLKSTGGRWDGSKWVTDTDASPCINAGNPASDYANEPEPNGNRINLGVFGNTFQASKQVTEVCNQLQILPVEKLQLR
jgi:hypothetical protein